MARQLTETVSLPDGSAMSVVVVTPDGDPPAQGWPGVVVLHEIFGVQPEILQVADRFAARGWAAIVPDYFAGGFRLGCIVRASREVRAGAPGPTMERVTAAAHHLGARSDVAGDRLAVVGFCLGGGLALLIGATTARGIRAVAANYGEVPPEAALRSSPPVVASYGGRDRSLAGADVHLRERLTACRVEHDVALYPAAGHAFLLDSHHPVVAALAIPLRAGYVPGAAEDAWRRIFAWLDAHVLGEADGRRAPGSP